MSEYAITYDDNERYSFNDISVSLSILQCILPSSHYLQFFLEILQSVHSYYYTIKTSDIYNYIKTI